MFSHPAVPHLCSNKASFFALAILFAAHIVVQEIAAQSSCGSQQGMGPVTRAFVTRYGAIRYAGQGHVQQGVSV